MASVVPLVERRHMAERGVALELGIPAPPGSAPFGHGGALPSIKIISRLVHPSPVAHK
jgi:hypothetical protein